MTHKTRVEADRSRVVCLECPWFMYELGADVDRLRQLGGWHMHAVALQLAQEQREASEA